MRFGIHLPQYGRAAGAAAIERTAQQADELGFDDVWESDQPVNFDGRFFHLRDMKVVPTPGRHVPVWIGGASAPALRRAITKGDGWHGTVVDPEKVKPIIERLRRDRPGDDFTISLRV